MNDSARVFAFLSPSTPLSLRALFLRRFHIRIPFILQQSHKFALSEAKANFDFYNVVS